MTKTNKQVIEELKKELALKDKEISSKDKENKSLKRKLTKKPKKTPTIEGKKKKRVYTSKQMEIGLKMEELGMKTDIPKSTLKRWKKDSGGLIRKKQAKELKKLITKENTYMRTNRQGEKYIVTGEQVRTEMDRFIEKVQKTGNIKQKGKLRVVADNESGYKVIS